MVRALTDFVKLFIPTFGGRLWIIYDCFPEHLNSLENVFISVKSSLALDQNMLFSYLFESWVALQCFPHVLVEFNWIVFVNLSADLRWYVCKSGYFLIPRDNRVVLVMKFFWAGLSQSPINIISVFSWNMTGKARIYVFVFESNMMLYSAYRSSCYS